MSATTDEDLLYCAAVPWRDVWTATPMMDFRHVRKMGEGTPYRYDRTARAFVQGRTEGYALSNVNGADLYGRRASGKAAARAAFYEDDLPRLVACEPEYGPPEGVVIVVPAADDGLDAGRVAYALRPEGTPPPGVLCMQV
jgi:hypothetical protein